MAMDAGTIKTLIQESIPDAEVRIEDLRGDDYEWEVEPAKKENGRNAGYYIMGYPK